MAGKESKSIRELYHDAKVSMTEKMSRHEGGSTLTQPGGRLLERCGGGGKSMEEIGTVVLGA